MPPRPPSLQQLAEVSDQLRLSTEGQEQAIEELRQSIREQEARLASLSDADASLGARIDDLSTRLEASSAKVGEQLEQQAEALATIVEERASALDAALEERISAALREELLAGDERVLAEAQRRSDKGIAVAAARSQERLDEARKALDAGREELRLSCEASSRDLRKSIEALGTRLDARLNELQKASSKALDALGAALREELAEADRSGRNALESGLAHAEATGKDRDARRGGQLEALEGSVQRIFDKLEHHDERHNVAIQEARNAKRDANDELAKVQADNCRRISKLEGGLSEAETSISQVSSTTTKQVEWSIEGIREKLRRLRDGADLEGAGAVFHSPVFHIAGARDLRFELTPFQDSDGSSGDTDGIGGNECSLALHCCDSGLRLSARVSIGSASENLKHTFDGESPAYFRRICTLVDEASSDGSLKVGLTVYDFSREAVVGAEAMRASASWGASKGSSAVAVDAAGRDATSRSMEPLGCIRATSVLNHRLLELIHCQHRSLMEVVQQKVSVVRSRAVRRVQWRLENAALLRRGFPVGRPICSTAFQAAGISGLQLIFYPSGCQGAKEGFCSFFLLCPAGCALRCWLWAGRWKREARPEAIEREDFVGRANFCRFESCVDPVDESVQLAVEIEEAQQLTRDGPPAAIMEMSGEKGPPSLVTTPFPGELRSVAATPSACPTPRTSRKFVDLERVDISTLKVDRSKNAKLAQDQVEQLPSIWTSQGFNTFHEIRDPHNSILTPNVSQTLPGVAGASPAGADAAPAAAAPPASEPRAALSVGDPEPQQCQAGHPRPPLSNPSSSRSSRPGRRANAAAAMPVPQKYAAYSLA